MNSYLNTEYITAINKARSGKQFAVFQQNKDAKPNIEWLPSSSHNPREAHKAYYHKVLPVDDSFWQENFPGNLWNCKCDWRATSETTTELPEERVLPSEGLEGNPAITNEIFTKDATWLKQAGKEGWKQAEKEIRNFEKQEAKALFYKKVNKEFTDKSGNKVSLDIGFDKRTLNHLTNDYFPNKIYKYLLYPKLDKLMQIAEYIDDLDNVKLDKKPNVERYYYFKVNLLGRSWILNVEKYFNNDKCKLYAINYPIKKRK